MNSNELNNIEPNYGTKLTWFEMNWNYSPTELIQTNQTELLKWTELNWTAELTWIEMNSWPKLTRTEINGAKHNRIEMNERSDLTTELIQTK